MTIFVIRSFKSKEGRVLRISPFMKYLRNRKKE